MAREVASDVGLVGVATSELTRLRAAVAQRRVRAPLSAVALSLGGFEALTTRLAPFYPLPRDALLVVLDAVLSERRRHEDALSLVWSGPDEGASSARDTATVLAELVGGAERSVLLAGYTFDRGSRVFAELGRAMTERHVRAAVYFDPDQTLPRRAHLEAPIAEYLAAAVARFVERNVAAGAPVPELYVDRRVTEPDAFWENGTPRVSLHAKCLVVDDARALVTSANFTGRGEKRNVEAGVLVRHVGFASSLAGQFRRLASLGAMVRVR